MLAQQVTPRYPFVHCKHHPQEVHPCQDAGASWCLKEVSVQAAWRRTPSMLWLYEVLIVTLVLLLIKSHD